MKKNTIKLLGVFGVLVAIYLIVLFSGDKSRSSSYRDVLVDIDTAKITTIEIETPTEKTMVRRVGEYSWQVEVGQGQKKATSSSVSNLITSLQGVKPSRLVARAANKWKDYAVDSSGTRVIIREGEKVSLDIMVGRFGVEGQSKFHTFVRLLEDDDVYMANDFMGVSLAKTSADFRDGNFLRLQADSLTAISFNYQDSAFSLTKVGSNWGSAVGAVDSTAMEDYLRNLGFVNSKKFGESDNLGSASLNVTYSFSNQPEVQLSAYQKGEEWIVKSSTNPNEVFADADIFEKVFKSKTDLIASE